MSKRSDCSGRCCASAASRRRRPSSTASATSVASSICTSARKPLRWGRCRPWASRTGSSRRTVTTATRSRAGFHPASSWPRCSARRPAAAGGRGGSMHFFDVSRRFYGGYAIVGGGLPIAVGLALADALEKRQVVTACFFGDGAVLEGEFHESMNLAALWRLPVLFLYENNLYAMGTAIERSQAQLDMELRARGYGVPAEVVDGMDVLAVEAATRRGVEAVRRRRRAAPDRVQDVPLPRSLHGRPRSLPDEGRGRGRGGSGIPSTSSSGPRGSTRPRWRRSRRPSRTRSSRPSRSPRRGNWEPVGDLEQDVYTTGPAP